MRRIYAHDVSGGINRTSDLDGTETIHHTFNTKGGERYPVPSGSRRVPPEANKKSLLNFFKNCGRAPSERACHLLYSCIVLGGIKHE